MSELEILRAEVQQLRAQVAAVRAVVAESQRITLTVSRNANILAALDADPGRCPWHTDGNSWALWAGTPSRFQCVLVAGHDGEHRPTLGKELTP